MRMSSFVLIASRALAGALLTIGAFLIILTGCPREPAEPNPLDSIPRDIPVYPRGRLVDLRMSELGMQMVLETNSGSEEVLNWYQRRLPRKGWTVVGSIGDQAEDGDRMVVAEKLERSLTISVRDPGPEEKQVITVNYMSRF